MPPFRTQRRSRNRAPEKTEVTRFSGWSGWRPYVAAGGLALACYVPTLRYGLVWDDPISIERWLPALRSLADVFVPPAAIPQFPPDYYRPLQLLSYKLDLTLGGGAAWAFHASSILWHLACTLLLLAVTRSLFAAIEPSGKAAFLAAALFAVHPVHSESVAWIAARPDPMVTGFGLAALLLALRSPRHWVSAVLAATLLFAALLCKETAIAFCILLPAAAGLAVSAPVQTKRQGSESAPIVSLATLWGAMSALASILYALLRHYGLQNYQAPPFEVASIELAPVFGALGFYWRKLVWPLPQNAYIAEVPDQWSELVLGAAGLGLLATLAFRAWQRGRPQITFACAWLPLTFAPSLAVLFRPGIAPVAERYAYLPSVAICWLLAFGYIELEKRFPRARKSLAAVTALLIGAAGIATVHRNSVWRDNVALWSDTARHPSADGFALRNLGAALLARGELEAAERYLQQALTKRNSPSGLVGIYSNLATIALQRQRWDEARAFYEKAYALRPDADLVFNLGVTLWARLQTLPEGEPARRELATQALARFQEAAQLSPWDPDIQVALGQCREILGDNVEAAKHYQRALQLGLRGNRAETVRQRLAEIGKKNPEGPAR